MAKPERRYLIRDGEEVPPSYDRAVRALTDAELEDELLSKRGEPGYRLALVAEADRRHAAGAPPEPARRARGFDAGEWEGSDGA